MHVVMNMSMGSGAAVAPSGVERKALQFDSSSESTSIDTGLDLDTSGDDVLADCTVLFGCRPNDSTVEFLMNATTLNNCGLQVRFTSSKLRVYVGTSSSQQKFSTGTNAWTQGDAHWGAFTWDGSDIELFQDGAVDTVSATNTRSASPGYSDTLRLNQGDDDNDAWEVAYVRAVLTLAQINALKALLSAGDYEAAADTINGYNASSGCLIGPTADDDSSIIVDGIREWTNDRTTITQSSPAIIDIPT